MWTCQKCGETVEASFDVCWNCGTSKSGVEDPNFQTADELERKPPHVPNHLVKAILVTILCCFPFGIVAIIYAAQVNPKLAGGDYDGAVQSSNSAQKWCVIAMLLGFVAFVLGVIANFANPA